MRRTSNRSVIAGIGSLIGACASARADGPPNYDFQWATVGAPGNTAYDGGSSGLFAGRGSVGYSYRITKHEISTAQYLEFLNTFSTDLGDPYLLSQAWGGFVQDSSYTGPGRKYKLETPSSGAWPVVGISWRNAARYCNWLQNGKSPTLAALASGAYDASTFGTDSDGKVTDAPTHLPGAQYWIPTLDEWMKAAHFDPQRYGPGQPGYWNYVNSTDLPLVPGLPGVGQTSAGFSTNEEARQIPLGAYADQVSPWGLLDLSGGGEEWTETSLRADDRKDRWYDGRAFGEFGDLPWDVDSIELAGATLATINGGDSTFRIVSAVPAPSGVVAFMIPALLAVTRRRKR